MKYTEHREALLKDKIIDQTMNEDLAAFWNEQVAALRAIPISFTREKLELPYEKAFTTYRVCFNTHDDTVVEALFSVPAGHEGEKLPCVARFHGGGGKKRIYPDTVARWLYNNTQEYNRIMHGGSGAANLYAAKAWNASAYGIDSVSALTGALAKGYIVTAIVGPGTFTSAGTTHEIVLWGSSAGSCNVYDPLGKTGKYSISSIWSQRSFDSYDLRGGYVFYAIYK
jgi:hypothetical protein